MRYFVKFGCSLVLMALLSVAAFGQEKWEEGEGEIQSVQIEIVKDKQITLPKANRNFEKIPPRPAEPIRPEITYELRSFNFNSTDFNPAIRPLKLKQEELSKIYGNYVSAGLGNYASPFAEVYLNSKRDKDKLYGAHFYHRSFGTGPVDKKNSASGNTNLDFFGKFFTSKVTTGAFAGYENRSGNFYGYPNGTNIEKDLIKQTYDVFNLGGEIENTKPVDFNFKLNAGFSYLKDRFSAKESELALSWTNDYKLSEKSKLLFSASYNLIARKDVTVDAAPRHLLKINPAYVFSPIDGLKLTAGLNTAIENDKNDSKSFHIYPNIWANYELAKSVEAYAGLTGDMDKVSLHTLSHENLWVNSNIPIFHTNRSAEFIVGLKGKAIKKLAFDAGVSVANLKELYFYRNAVADASKFDLVYDNSTQRVNLFADLGVNFADKVRLNARGDYFGYAVDNVMEAWHRPTYRLGINSSFNIYDKLTLTSDLIAQGGMKAFDDANNKTVTLDPAFDLSLKVNYFLSKKFSVFVSFNNILSSDYPLYLNYPVRGFQVMGGLAWSF